jgi:hypothetical protein
MAPYASQTETMRVAVRVAQAVGTLVVKPHDQRDRLEAGDARHHLGAPVRVQPDQPALLSRQPTGLREQLLGKAQLADVVEERAQLHLDQLGAVQPEPPAESHGSGRDLERVPVGIAVRLRQGLHERADLRLRVPGRELAPRVVGEGFPGEDAELSQELHLTGFELSLLVPAADAQRPALLGFAQDGR